MADPRVGTVLEGRYRIQAPLAAGGMGVVYRGERIQLGRTVAIKFLHAFMASDAGARKRFEIEARATASLQHPNCAAVIDYGIADDAPYVVMDFVEGETLRDVIERGPLPAPRALAIVRQVLAGLAHAHAQGIVHRDIKPANIMLSQVTAVGDLVRILDFGLARIREGGSGLTQGFIIGTPSYMAPEQTLSRPVDARTDIYAAGIMLYELLLGAPPYRADSSGHIMMMHREAPVPSLRVAAPQAGFSETLDAALAQALAKDPDERFAAAGAFAAALDAAPEARQPVPGPVVCPAAPVDSSAPTSAGTGVTAIGARRPSGFEATALQTGTTSDAVGGTTRTEPPGSASTPPAPALQTSATPPHALVSLPPPPMPSTGRPRRVTMGIAGAVGLAIAAIAVVSISTPADPASADAARAATHEVLATDQPPEAEAAPPPEPPVEDAPAIAEPAKRENRPEVTRAREMIAAGRRSQAIKYLVKLRRAHPRDPEIPYLLGQVYFERMWFSDGMEAYRAALALEPAYREDATLIKSTLIAFRSPRNAPRVSRFLAQHVGAAAVPYIREVASDHPNPRTRTLARRALRRFPSASAK